MNEYYKIKDKCRQGLIKYLENACIKLPRLKNHNILDIGCGSGVPTIWLSENFSGNITAIDSNPNAINYLKQKIENKKLQNSIRTICSTFEEFITETDHYDMILAEGFLNIVGFETGFKQINKLLKEKGYFVIHDEYKDHNWKLEFIKENNCTLFNTLFLDENIWWDDYYKPLESEISKIKTLEIEKIFKSDIEEINYYKSNPSLFKSIYYIIMKN